MPIIVIVDGSYRKTDRITHHGLKKVFIAKKDKPTVTKNENPSADFNNDGSLNLNEGIRRRTTASTDGLGSTGKDEQPNEDSLGSSENEQSSEGDLGSTEDPNLAETDLFVDWTVGGFLALIGIMMFGYHNTDQCPGNVSIPYMVILIALLSVTILFFAGLNTNCLIFDCLKKSKRMVLKISALLFACVWIVEFALFNYKDVSFDSSADNYCDRTFCILINVMNTCVAFGIGAALVRLSQNPDFFNRTSSETPRPAYRLFPFESDSDSDSS